MKVLLIILFFIPQTIGNLGVPNYSPEKVEESVEMIKKQLVTLTIYSPTESETDSTPNVTASGFKIDNDNPGKHKIIAISRDLKRKGWKFGKKVRIKKAGKYNGVYTIRDLMNKRHKNRIDVLVDSEYEPIKLRNVEVTLLN
jgi:3D (Asp-Asp-Asp) domain-containing protein